MSETYREVIDIPDDADDWVSAKEMITEGTLAIDDYQEDDLVVEFYSLETPDDPIDLYTKTASLTAIAEELIERSDGEKLTDEQRDHLEQRARQFEKLALFIREKVNKILAERDRWENDEQYQEWIKAERDAITEEIRKERS